MTPIPSAPAVSMSNRRGALALALPLLVVAGCLLFYAGLVPLGYWQGDEFLTLRSIEGYGISSLVWRLTAWSPRPVSEGLLYSYMMLVLSSGRQLIAPMMGALWCILFLAMVLPTALVRRRELVVVMASAVVLGGALAQPLSSRHFHDAFFFVQSAIAYIPTIAALLAILALLCFGSVRTRTVWIVVCALLAVIATSSEVGAFFVLLFAGLLLAVWAIGAGLGKQLRSQSMPPPVAVAVPFAVAVTVMALIFFGRLGEPQEAVYDTGTAHRIGASFLATLQTLPWDLTGQKSETGVATWFSATLLPKLLFGAGALLVFAAVRPLQRRENRYLLLAFGAAALGTAFLALFAGYYQFGHSCCGRHETMREVLGMLALTSLAAAASTLLGRRAGRARVLLAGSCLVALASVLSVRPEAPRLLASYARYDVVRDTMAWNWQQTREPGRSMAYRLRGTIYSSEYGWTPGTYRLGEGELPGPVLRMLELFRKDTLDILPPLPAP